jgi:hypothetical protein
MGRERDAGGGGTDYAVREKAQDVLMLGNFDSSSPVPWTRCVRQSYKYVAIK